MNRPTVVAVSNRKGGSGKTTTAVNLAAQWAVSGWRTLLIDLDTQSHSAIGLGIEVERSGAIHRLFDTPSYTLQQGQLATALNNLTLIGADIDYETRVASPDYTLLQRQAT